MFVKSLLAGAIALVLNTSEQGFTTTTAFVVDPYIERINCDEGSGTGFKLADGRWLSAHHVTSMSGCKIDGIPVVVTYADEMKDYDIFTVPGDHRRGGLRVDCSGYHDGQWFHGQGHAKGLPVITSVPVLYSAFMNVGGHPRDWAILIYNRFIPGQSGGPVKSNAGEVVGIVNAYSIFTPASFSIPLSETVICQ